MKFFFFFFFFFVSHLLETLKYALQKDLLELYFFPESIFLALEIKRSRINSGLWVRWVGNNMNISRYKKA